MIEAIADGSYEPGVDDAQHLASCALCSSRLARARAIESLLGMREVAAPSSSFASAVMARVGQEHWKTERVVDLGFNLAIAAGTLVILAGGGGLAWSLGLVSVTIDREAIWRAVGADVTGRVLSQMQTIAMAAVLLTMTLVFWWWAETATD
ncbi:MAG: hypothetical protein ABI024_08335 [Vicinamibacterales bacterium]